MELFDNPSSIMATYLSIISFNILPYHISNKSSDTEKFYAALSVPFVFVLLYFGILSQSSRLLTLNFVIFSVSYLNFCFSLKKRIPLKCYAIIFIIISLLFVFGITAIFGQYYVKSNLVDTSNYMLQYNTIINTHDCGPIMDFKLSILFFDVGFETYSILPDLADSSLKNPFFIPLVFRIILNGIIISLVVDIIKYFVMPVKKN